MEAARAALVVARFAEPGRPTCLRERERRRWLDELELRRAVGFGPPECSTKDVQRAKVAEGILTDGQSVEVFGVLGREVDPDGASGYRDAPTRPVIRSGETPLVLFGAG